MTELIEGDDCICENCGSAGTVQPDPFNSDINNDNTLHKLCDECAHESAMEI